MKVNVEAQAKRSAYPGSREFIAKPHSVFCLLYSVFRLLPNTPILPSLPRIHETIMQNKPNSRSAKTTATSYATHIYSNIPLRAAPKKQTQTKPIPQRNTRYATRNTKNKPNETQFRPAASAPRYAIRATQYAIRNTKYEPCTIPAGQP